RSRRARRRRPLRPRLRAARPRAILAGPPPPGGERAPHGALPRCLARTGPTADCQAPCRLRRSGCRRGGILVSARGAGVMEQDATAGTAASPHARRGNRYDLAEWAGAFGDLGTLLPFVLAYIAVVKIDPLGMLLGFGLAMIAVGLCYKTPVPVQPMKAIGAVAATQAAQTVALTPQAVFVSGLATGLIWLALGATGLAQRLSRLIPRPIAIGIVLGLGFAFMLKGIEMMAGGWVVAGLRPPPSPALLPHPPRPAQ